MKKNRNEVMDEIAALLRAEAASEEPMDAVRRKLVEAALALAEAVAALDDAGTHPLPYADAAAGTEHGLGAAFRAAAGEVRHRSDWAALLMLLNERLERKVADSEMCQLVANYCPDAPQPRRQGIGKATVDTLRHRFPDWPPQMCRRDKYARYMAIAHAAAPHIP